MTNKSNKPHSAMTEFPESLKSLTSFTTNMKKMRKIKKLKQPDTVPWFNWNNESNTYFLNPVGGARIMEKINEIISVLNSMNMGNEIPEQLRGLNEHSKGIATQSVLSGEILLSRFRRGKDK